MNKIVKQMFKLAETDQYRKNKKVKWDMYFLYMGFTSARASTYKRKIKK
jgi:hypothetical protein|tara:strand:+ start:9248 stop:9394 length:147 start_codon:yes stop_codon:yes gene_type:complete